MPTLNQRPQIGEKPFRDNRPSPLWEEGFRGEGLLASLRRAVSQIAVCSVLASLAGVVALPALAHAGGARQDVLQIKRLAPEAPVEEDRSLEETVAKVRSSFLDRDSGALEGCFGSAKVFVSLKSAAGKPGYYTSSQLLFILEKLFRDVSTRGFEYTPRDLTVADDGRAFLRSEWTYVLLDSDTLVSEHLHFAFVKEKEGWRIAEIKSSTR